MPPKYKTKPAPPEPTRQVNILIPSGVKPATPETTRQVNILIPSGVAEAWEESAKGRDQKMREWLRDAAEHWAALCAAAKVGGITPHELAAVQHADHSTVDGMLAELQTIAATRPLQAPELALLQRLDPQTWRTLTGTSRPVTKSS